MPLPLHLHLLQLWEDLCQALNDGTNAGPGDHHGRRNHRGVTRTWSWNAMDKLER